MKKKILLLNCVLKPKHRVYRLHVAFILALGLLFLPLKAALVFHVSVPLSAPVLPQRLARSEVHPNPATVESDSGQGIAFSLPVGVLPVQATRGLTITKIVDFTEKEVGGLLKYTLLVTNNTGVTLTKVAVTDTVPTATKCLNMEIPLPWLGDPLTCQVGVATWSIPDTPITLPPPFPQFLLANGASANLTYTVQINSALPDQYQVVNEGGSYEISAYELNNSANTFTDTQTVSISTTVMAPAWTLTKTVVPTPTVIPGQFMTYTLFVTNTGTWPTSGPYTITDVLPDNTTFISSVPPISPVNRVLTWTLPALPPSLAPAPMPGNHVVVSYVVSVTNPLTPGLAISNMTYAVRGGNVFSDELGSPVIVTVETSPDFAITKHVNPPNRLKADQSVTYTIRYTNSIPVPATNIRITDTMPISITTLLAVTTSGASIVDNILPTLVFTQDTLINDTGLITIVGQLVPSPWSPTLLDVTNQVSVTLNENSTLYTATVTALGGSNDPITATYTVDPAEAVIGTLVPITVTLIDLYNNPVGDGLTVPFSTTFGTMPDATTSGGQAVGFLNSTTPGTVTVEIDKTGLSSLKDDPRTVITFTAALLEIHKTVDNATAQRNDQLVYTIVVTNNSQTIARNVLVTDTLPATVTLGSSSPGGTFLPPPVYIVDLGDMGPFAVTTIKITVTVGVAALDGDQLVNRVMAGANGTITFPTASATTTVQAPAFAITKSGLPPVAVAGDPITYTITYTSDGSLPVTGLRLTDTLPLSLTNVRVTSSTTNIVEESALSSTFIFNRSTPFFGTEVITITGQLATNNWPLVPINLTNVVTATIAGPAANTTFIDQATISASAGPPFTVTLLASPAITDINSTVAVTATIVDQYGNPILNGLPVTFSSNSSSLFFTSLNPVNTLNGLANVTLTSPVGESPIISATVGGVTGTTVVTFTTPGLQVTKLSDRSTVPPNGQVVFTILMTNTGNTVLTDVVATDILVGGGLQFVSAEPTPSASSPPSYVFDLPDLPAGMTQTVVLTALVTPGWEGVFQVNSAIVTATQLLPPFPDASVGVMPIGGTLDISKDVSPAVVLAGGIMTYTIVYTNNTHLTSLPTTITNILLTDTLPAEVSNVLNIDPGGAALFSSVANTLVFTRAALIPAASDVITVVAQVMTAPWPAAGLPLMNMAVATSDQDLNGQTAQATNQGRPNVGATVSIPISVISATVGSNVAITVTITDQYGNPIYDGTGIDFSSSLSGTAIISTTAANGVVTAIISSTVSGTTTIVAATGPASNSLTITFIEITAPVTQATYLPLILEAFANWPDLLVEAIEVSPANPNIAQPVVISVTIRNVGTAPTSRFWVDLYLTDRPITPQVNQPWTDFGNLGVAWLVPGLVSGQSLTLTNLKPNAYDDPNNCENYSRFTPSQVDGCSWPANSNSFTTGGTYYMTVLVDAFDEDATLGDGNIVESDETNNVYSTPLIITVNTRGGAQPKEPQKPAYESPIPGTLRTPLKPIAQ